MPVQSTSMAQVNVRMDPALKASGDATLLEADVTPSQLIRAVWSKLSQGIEAFDQLATVLANDSSSHLLNFESRTSKTDPLIEGIRNRQATFERMLGLDASTYVAITEEEMEELFFDEHMHRDRARRVDDVD